MRNLILVILTIGFFVTSCSWLKLNDTDISSFEQTLSTENVSVLNLLAEKFDQMIYEKFPAKNFPDSSYYFFFKSFCNKDDKYFEFIEDSIAFETLLKIANNNDFKNDIILIPDTMFLIDSNTLIRDYIYRDRNQNICGHILDTFNLPPNPKNIDLLKIDFFRFLEDKGQLKLFNVFGDFYSGLEEVKDRNEFITGYIDFKKNVFSYSGIKRPNGFIDPETLSCSLINDKISLNDYFVKRIFIVELLFKNTAPNSGYIAHTANQAIK